MIVHVDVRVLLAKMEEYSNLIVSVIAPKPNAREKVFCNQMTAHASANRLDVITMAIKSKIVHVSVRTIFVIMKHPHMRLF